MTSTLGRILVLLAVLAPASAARADKPADPQAELEASVKQLIPPIEKVRGLKFNKPVVAKILHRPKDDRPGVQGYYDIKKKTLFLYDDVKSSYWKGVLVHEMVHALQDQHFGLEKLHDRVIRQRRRVGPRRPHRGRCHPHHDRGPREGAAACQAHAVDSRWRKARNLQNAFLYGQGARYVQALKKKGGWADVNFRYNFLPQTTAVDPPSRRAHRGGQPRPGQAGRRAGFDSAAAQPAGHRGACPSRRPRDGAATATIEEGDSRGWVVAFAAAEQAGRFFAALAALRSAEYPGHKLAENEPMRRIWRSEKGAMRGILLRGARVLELTAADAKAYQALLDRVVGPPKLHIYSAKEKRSLTFGELMDRLLEGDLICIGETHDSELDHQVQRMIIQALYARDERLGVGMEMFQRPYQKSLDRYVSGAINEETLLEDSDYQKRWGWDWKLYQPIVQFCRRNKVPLAALNVAEELRKKVRKSGYDNLASDDKKLLGAIDFHVKEHRAHWYEKLGKMHGHGELSPETKERFYQVMTIWDEYMADSAATFQKERNLRRMVILAGSGHINRGFGIPARAAKRTGGKALTVQILLGGDPAKAAADPAADFVVAVQ